MNPNRKNLANAFLAAPITAAATTMTYVAGYGAGKPAVPYFDTLTPQGQLSTMGNSEIVQVTALSGDTATIVRARKGTDAKAFPAGTIASNGIYVEDKIGSDNIDFTTFKPVVYSTTENRVGTWIDNKPVYRRVFTGTISAAGNVRHSETLGENVKEIISVGGYWYESPELSVVIPTDRMQVSGAVDGNTTVLRNTANNGIFFATKSNFARSNMPFALIVEYTKTTD